MAKYLVTVARTGGVVVEADSKDEAMKIADAVKHDNISWDDDWAVTEVQEVVRICSIEFKREGMKTLFTMIVEGVDTFKEAEAYLKKVYPDGRILGVKWSQMVK